MDGLIAHFSLRIRFIDLHSEGPDRLGIDIAEDPKAMTVLCAWAKSSDLMYLEWWPQAGAEPRSASWFDGEKWFAVTPETSAWSISSLTPPNRQVYPDYYFDTFDGSRISHLLSRCRIGLTMFDDTRFGGVSPLRMRVEFEHCQWHGPKPSLSDYRTVAWRFQEGQAIRYSPVARSYSRISERYVPSCVAMDLPLLWLGKWPEACRNNAPTFLDGPLDFMSEISRDQARWSIKQIDGGQLRFTSDQGSTMDFDPGLGWALTQRVRLSESGRGAKLQAADFRKLEESWFPHKLQFTIFDIKTSKMLFSLEAEVIKWEAGRELVLVPEAHDVPGSYEQTGDEFQDWHQITPGGLDLLLPICRDLARNFPRPEEHDHAMKRVLYIWLPVTAIVVGIRILLRSINR